MPLSEFGRAQARALARSLAAVSFDRIISSDLSRAFETAQEIARHRALIVDRDPRLRERDFGDWEGLRWTEIIERFPCAAPQDWSEWYQRTPSGGEDFQNLRARVSAMLSDVLGQTAQRVLLVSHAGALNVALAVLFGGNGPQPDVALLPTSLTRIVLGADDPTVVTFNDVSHLESSLALMDSE